MKRSPVQHVLTLALTLGLLVVTILLVQAVQDGNVATQAQQPDLTVTKTDSVDPLPMGGTLTYTLSIASTRNQTTTHVVVTDTLDSNTTLVLSETTNISLTCLLKDVSDVVCTLTEMAPNSQEAITLVVTTTDGFTGTLTNVATVDSDNTDPNSDIETTEVQPEADLGITKAATPNPATAGGSLTYVLTATNSGPMDAYGVVVTDTLPGGVVYSPSPTPGASCSHNAGTVTCDVGALANGASERIELVVDVNADVTASLVNAAEVGGGVIDANAANDQTSITTMVIQSADVEIVKKDDPDPVSAGSVLTYTLGVSNLGPSTAQAVTVTDTLPAEVVYRSSDPSVGTFDQATGRWSVGDLAPATPATLTLLVDVDPNFTGVITNFAEVSSSTFDPITTTGNSASITTSVVFEADLQVAKQDTPDPVVAGTTLTYTVIVTNAGPSTATGVVLTDTLPSGLTLGRHIPSQGIYTPTTGIWSVGVLSPSFTATLLLEALVDPGTRDTLTNTAQVRSQADDRYPTTNVVTETTTVVAKVDLEIAKGDFPDPVAAGTTLTYTVVITNHGPSQATGIWLTDTLPVSVTFGSANPQETSGPNPLLWSLVNLDPGLSTTVVVVVTPAPWISTTLTNEVEVSAKEPEPHPDPSPNQDTEDTAVKPLCEVIQVTDTLTDVVNAWPSIGGLGGQTRIAYLSNRTGREELFVATLTNTIQTQQATTSTVGTSLDPPSISGDGRRVAFISDGDYDPWMANADGSAEVFVYGTRFGAFENVTGNAGSVFPGFVLSASPDDSGGRLTFASDYDYSGGNPDANLEVWLYDSADGPFRQVDGGDYHTCGLRADGSIACWGYDAFYQTLSPKGPFRQISAGGFHTCGLRDTGSLLCWGYDAYGQAPSAPAGQYRQVSAGQFHTCAVKDDGSIACWGDNGYGQASPPGGNSYVAVSAGGYHTCALQATGSVVCWGRSDFGQAPAAPAGQYQQVSAGGYHTCGLQTDGSVVCWGYTYYGQTLVPSTTEQWMQISAGRFHTCGLLESGTALCWGYNAYGQASVPAGSGPFSWVSAGGYHTCGVEENGGLACWGYDAFGQASPPSGGRNMFQITDSTQSSSSPVATSGNGQYVAFLSNADLDPLGGNADKSVELFVGRLDPAALQIAQVTHTAFGVAISNPSISYDGSRIAFLSDGDLVPATGNPDGNSEIFMAELDPANLSGPITLIQITDTGSGITQEAPALSGDGQTIAFVSDGELDPLRDNADLNPELYLAVVDSLGTFIQTTLTGQAVTNATPSVNHLGTQIAFVSNGSLRPSPGNLEGNQEVFVASCRLPMPAAELSIDKTGPIVTFNGRAYPYSLLVTNSGQTPAYGVEVTDQIAGGASLYPGDPRCEEKGSDQVVCYASELAAGSTMTFTVWARVESTVGPLINSVDAWAVNAPVPVSDQLVIAIGQAADLSVAKSTLARWVTPGETITYTIVIDNDPLGLATNVTVTDTVGTHLSYSGGTAELTGGSCGLWQGDSIVCTHPSLAAGGTATLTLTITPQKTGVITNTVRVKGGYQDPNPDNNEASVVLGPPPIYLPIILKGG